MYGKQLNSLGRREPAPDSAVKAVRASVPVAMLSKTSGCGVRPMSCLQDSWQQRIQRETHAVCLQRRWVRHIREIRDICLMKVTQEKLPASRISLEIEIP
ncbi:MAG: trigger factor family protein, partial [Aphanothece sp. CMT-3BRIN-NPC111]|nr:trigger factor family protein [Aphanothece sp. CMT-3BRIN-NPC111]